MPFDFSAYPAVLLDLDGTLFHDAHPLPGAIALVQRLQKERVRFACLTNSGSSPAVVMQRLAGVGIELPAGSVYTAATAACDYIRKHLPRGAVARKPRIYKLVSESCAQLLAGEVDWVERPDEPCDAILVASLDNPAVTPDRLFVALQLARRGAELIGLCADRVYPSTRGMEFGAGALTLMLSYAAGVTPTFCGKPDPKFFEELCQHLAVAPPGCLLIGDNLESDIVGAKRVGMRTILTLTGVSRQSEVDAAAPQQRPDLVIADLTALLTPGP